MYNDYELVYLAQEDNSYVLEILYNKYYKLLDYKGKKIYSCLKDNGISYEDVMQEVILCFFDAVKSFNQDNKAKFSTFLSVCLDRKLANYVLKNTRKKDSILNKSYSLDLLEDIGYDYVGCNNDPIDVIINEEEYVSKYESIMSKLSFNEGFVFEMLVNYLTISEISDILSCDKKDVYNTIRRIKEKIKRIYMKKLPV